MALPIFKAPVFSLIVKSSSSVWKEEDPGGAGCLLKKLLGVIDRNDTLSSLADTSR